MATATNRISSVRDETAAYLAIRAGRLKLSLLRTLLAGATWTVATMAALLIVGTAIAYGAVVSAGILVSFVLVSDHRLASGKTAHH